MKKNRKDIKASKYAGKTIAVSGGFDPVHVGHLSMFEAAKKIVGPDGVLIVFVNSDKFLKNKKGRPFMRLPDRLRLIRAFATVDKVIPVIDSDMSICKTLMKYRPHVFANGGDRTKGNIPEYALCKKLKIKMIFNVGGKKIRSSSEFLADFSRTKK